VQPFADDDTQPIKLPTCVQAARTCRPALTRVTGVGIGQTKVVPADRRAGLVVGRSPEAGIRIDDHSVSREHARVHVADDGSTVLTDLGSTNGTLVNGRRVESCVLSEGDKIQVGTSTVFRFSLNDRLDEHYLEHLYERSIRDTLTGLLNRRYLSECLDRDLAFAKRHEMPVSLVLIDADFFKKVNDAFGHSGGDEVLQGLAELLAGMQRSESILARFGGEEFAVLLRNVEVRGAEIFAERMRLAVEQRRFAVGRGSVGMTVSVGVACTKTDGVDTPEELFDRADRYLYLSKTRGRNCVTSASSFTL
jgi:diguanylate cyclase (GGDEF)-like protein